MGNKNKCDNPFSCHSFRDRLGKFGRPIDENVRTKSAVCHPNINWKDINFLCIECRKKALSETLTCPVKKRYKSAPEARSVQDGEAVSSIPFFASEMNEFENASSEMDYELSGTFHTRDYSQQSQSVVPQSQDMPLSYESQLNQEMHSSQEIPASQSSSTETVSTQASYVAKAQKDFKLASLNSILENCDLQIINATTLHKPHELRDLYGKIIHEINKKIQALHFGDSNLELDKHIGCSFCENLFCQLSEKIKLSKNSSDRYKMLTCIPSRYNATEIKRKTGCSKYMTKKALDLKCDFGAFSAPNPRDGNKLSQTLKDLVRAFYLDPSHSRPSPRSNDTICGPNGTRLAKHHMLMNTRDLFSLFKNDYPEKRIGKTSFLLLRPRECIWPGHRPFHNVCLCIIHQNFKLQYAAVKSDKDFRPFVQDIFCKPMRTECAFGLCDECPNWYHTRLLFVDMEADDIIQYQQWTQQDGTNYENLSMPVADFTDKFETSLMKFIEHDYINAKQNSFISYIKSNILPIHPYLLIQVDFAQNYSMVVQDSVYGFHWSKRQATIHPFSVTWFDKEANVQKEKNYVVISDTLDHNTNIFNSFKRKVLARIIIDFPDSQRKHIFYLSDGCGGQYKNSKNMAHLMEHYNDFGITAEWIFTASYHGKGPCDRVSAIVKRTTRIHSLTPGVILTTAKQMFEFCVKKLESDSLVFLYITTEELVAEEELFNERYELFKKTIPGTRRFHHFVPTQNLEIQLKRFSSSDDVQTFSFRRDTTPFVDPNDLEIGHFYCFVEAEGIQVGMLVDVFDLEVEFQCMRMNKGNQNLRWPRIAVNRQVPKDDILLCIQEPQLGPGNYYVLTSDEKDAMKERFKIYKHR